MEFGTIYLLTAKHPNGSIVRCKVGNSGCDIDTILLRYHGRSDDQTVHRFTTLNGHPVAISGRAVIEYKPIAMDEPTG
jgi:hypothetical protein